VGAASDGAAAPLRARHGDAFTLRLSFDDAPTVPRLLPAAVRDVWAASPEVLRRGQSPGPLRRVAGPRSILLADGAEHLRIRRLMLPPFHGERLAARASEVAQLCREAVARCRAAARWRCSASCAA
jgi:cytochrome P450